VPRWAATWIASVSELAYVANTRAMSRASTSAARGPYTSRRFARTISRSGRSAAAKPSPNSGGE
jgi:hypothetical protein